VRRPRRLQLVAPVALLSASVVATSWIAPGLSGLAVAAALTLETVLVGSLLYLVLSLRCPLTVVVTPEAIGLRSPFDKTIWCLQDSVVGWQVLDHWSIRPSTSPEAPRSVVLWSTQPVDHVFSRVARLVLSLPPALGSVLVSCERAPAQDCTVYPFVLPLGELKEPGLLRSLLEHRWPAAAAAVPQVNSGG
jgi:hypothetical protein